jgi:hypothetical protein
VTGIIRALAALTAVALLSVDDIDQEGEPMDKPTGIGLEAWARYNENQNRALAELSGLPAPEPGVPVPRAIEVRSDITAAVAELTRAVRRAASELEGTGETGDRVAVKLLTALARFASETEMP